MTPKTEAGNQLVNSQVWVGVSRDLAKAVDAIETEAFAAGDRQGWDSGIIAERERIRAAVKVLEPQVIGNTESYERGFDAAITAVLNIIEERDDMAEYRRAMHRGYPDREDTE